jgi:hypothetical protein
MLSFLRWGHDMNVFICWSGRRGKRAAQALEAWLEEVFGTRITPKVSLGIEKGLRWRGEVEKILDGSDAGLLCLTQEALRSSWVNFEAGVLSSALGGARSDAPDAPAEARRLFTFLWGIDASMLDGPLAAFQSTDAGDEQDVLRLIEGLASRLKIEVKDPWRLELKKRWPELWQSLVHRLRAIPAATLMEVCPSFESLFQRKTFEVPTDQCVDEHWLARYEVARATLTTLHEHSNAVTRCCRGYTRDLWRELEREVDSYAMAISLLVGSKIFGLDESGCVKVEPRGLLEACETRRRRVRQLVARLVDPNQASFLDNAVRFDAAEEFAERKNLVHRLTPEVISFAESNKTLPRRWPADAFCFEVAKAALILGGTPSVSDSGGEIDLEERWRTSEWPFDRIMYGIFLEQRFRQGQTSALLADAINFAEAEMEKTRAQQPAAPPASEPGASVRHARVMALHYALGPLTLIRPASASSEDIARIESLAQRVIDFLDKRGTRDEPVRSTVAAIRRQLAAVSPIHRCSSTIHTRSTTDETPIRPDQDRTRSDS